MSRDKDYFSFVDAERPVLAGHKRVRKKLIAPLSDLPSAKQISFTHDIYPELLWIGLLFDQHGFRGGIEVAAPFQLALSNLLPAEPYYRLSRIGTVSRQEWEKLEEPENPYKEAVGKALAPLAELYPQLPLAFVDRGKMSRSAALVAMKTTVSRHSNRFETPGAALIGAYVFLLAFTGKMRLPRTTLEGLNDIVGNPGSDAAELASSVARATMLASWSIDQAQENEWPPAFWRENWRLSDCELGPARER